MRHIDEDSITQAVIARHAAAGDARSRELMTSLVQHLHAFVREVKLTEAEWAEGVRFVTECGQLSANGRNEVALLSGTLGLSALVTALNQRKPRGCTEPTGLGPCHAGPEPHPGPSGNMGEGEEAREPCYVKGRVRALDGTPIAGAELRVWPADGAGATRVFISAADGSFHFKCNVARAYPIPQDGPVGRMLGALGRHPWRPAHLHFIVSAPGCETLATQVFRRGDKYLDSDALFGVRSSLVADWEHHAPGRTPDGHTSAEPFSTLDFEFVLNTTTTGDRP